MQIERNELAQIAEMQPILYKDIHFLKGGKAKIKKIIIPRGPKVCLRHLPDDICPTGAELKQRQ